MSARGPLPQGLRLRIWLGCTAGAVVSALSLVWVAGALAPGDGSLDPILLAVFPWTLAVLGVLVGVAMAMWLDHNIVGHLRGLSRALANDGVVGLRGLPAVAEWGELSDLTQSVQRLITRMDRLHAEAEESRRAREQLERTLEEVMTALEKWAREAAEPFPSAAGPLSAIAEVLQQRDQRAREREREQRERGREAVLEIRAGVRRGLEEARETESQAERGFVEATALLTTVRELQRLRGELEQALAAAGEANPAEPVLEALERYRIAAAGAIEELVGASTASVERLAAGLVRVQEISDHVHTLSNRATLVALDAAIGAAVPGRDWAGTGITRPGERAAELRRLASEVQAVTSRTTALAREVDREVAAAIDHMRGLREHLSGRLEPMPAVAAGGDARALERAARLLDRVREMIQDAMQKGERLSATGERASTAAQRLVRRLEEEVPALESLIDRLANGEEAEDAGAQTEEAEDAGAQTEEAEDAEEDADSGDPEAEDAGAQDPEAEDPSGPDAPGPGSLKLLTPDDVAPGARRDAGEKDAREPGPARAANGKSDDPEPGSAADGMSDPPRPMRAAGEPEEWW